MKNMSLQSSSVYHHHNHPQNPRPFLALCSKKTSIYHHFSPHRQQTLRAITSLLTDPSRTKPVLLSQRPNAVGIIGGSSALSTLIFLERLVWWGSRRGKTCPPFVLCSDNHSSGFFMEGLKRKREFLEGSGAGCVVMPCHMAHMWHAEVAEECCVPFLHVGECVARKLSEAKMRPLEVGGNVKVGVLSLDEALVHVIYQAKLENKGFEVVLPDKATMEHIVVPSAEALRNGDVKGAQNLLKIAVQILLMRGSNTVIIASDELRGLIPHDDPLLKKCTDPIDILARSTITWAKSKEHVKV